MFEFPNEVSDVNTVPAEFRSLYIQQGEKYVINETTKAVVGAIQGQQKALTAARNDAKTAQGKAIDLTSLSEYGEDVGSITAKVKEVVEALQGEVAKGKDGKINLEKIKEDLAKAHAGEMKVRDARIVALQGQLYSHLVESVATKAIADAKGSHKLLMPHITKQVKVTEKDGAQSVVVVDAQGDLRYSNVTGEPMTITNLVEEMKGVEDFGAAFASETKSGGSAAPGSKQPTGQRKAGDMSANEKISAGLAKKQHQTG